MNFMLFINNLLGIIEINSYNWVEITQHFVIKLLTYRLIRNDHFAMSYVQILSYYLLWNKKE
jgi:hypothetical protein